MTVINVAEMLKNKDKRENQDASNFVIKVGTQLVTKTNGYYRSATSKKTVIKFDISANGVKRRDIDQLNLVAPLSKFIDGKKVDEMYLDVGILQGEFAITGTFSLPGRWVLDFNEVNESLKLINSDWKLSGENITFLV